jgi:hypothetical protein
MPFDTNVSVNDTGAVRDYTSSSGDGTLGGGNDTRIPKWTSNGISGGAYEFDGVDDSISRSGDSSNLTIQFSASAWIYPKQQRTQQILVCNYLAQFGLRVNSGNALHMVAYGTYLPNWTLYDLVGTSGEIPLNEWSHVAFTVDGTNLKLYKNGALVKSGSIPGTYLAGSNGGCNIGYFASWAPTRFNGTIDEVLVYDKILSAEQIAAMYNNGVPRHNIIVSQETSLGDGWRVAVTPNKPTGDGTSVLSNNLNIGSPPTPSPLTISVESPTNMSYTNDSEIWFNATADATVDTWILNYNGTNITGFTINTSRTLEVGNHHLLLYANDSSGNLGLNDDIYFRVYSPTSSNVTENETNETVVEEGGNDTYLIFYPTQIQLEQGYEKALKEKWRIYFEFNGQNYTLEVKNIFNETVTLSLSDDLMVFNLSEDQTRNLNLDNDDFYDVEVYLKDIALGTFSEADLILKLISEESTIDEESEENGGTLGNVVEEPKSQLWKIIGSIFLVLVIVVVGVVISILVKKKKEEEESTGS